MSSDSSGSAVRSSSGNRSKRERDTSSDNLAAAAGTTQGRKSFDVPNAEGRCLAPLRLGAVAQSPLSVHTGCALILPAVQKG